MESTDLAKVVGRLEKDMAKKFADVTSVCTKLAEQLDDVADKLKLMAEHQETGGGLPRFN